MYRIYKTFLYMEVFMQLVEELKRLTESTNAGRGYVDFTREDGSVIRVEYKPSKKRTK